MNEGLQKALTDLITRLTQAIDGATVQIPDLVHDLVAFNITNTWVWLGFYAVIAGISIGYIGWFLWSIWRGKWDEWGDCTSAFLVIGLAVAMIVTVVMMHSVVDSSTTLVALYHYPNVWVLSYLRGML